MNVSTVPELTPSEVFWLTRWMWIYELESNGFTKAQARRLVSLRLVNEYAPAEVR